MIELSGVTKTFPGAAHPAVDRLDLAVPEGAICVLIGPSGCGKTTTMRMVNRLIEPSTGTIRVGGEDVTRVDPVRLRRRIGYVIQQVGLFPHMTIAQNVATVPDLLGWPAARIRARTAEMLDLVGLEPDTFLARYPRHLSGGQRQRVGVARALAADPPVLLMDEPFGAVDPLVRGRLQGEFRAILRRLRKTVIFVTHDLDEAVRMGDLVGVMRAGRLVQLSPPAELLARPVDGFVTEFVGADRALRGLALVTAGEACRPGPAPPDAPRVAGATPLREALSTLLASRSDVLAVTGEGGTVLGTIDLPAIRERVAPA